MTKFEEDFDNNVEIFDVIGNHNSMCCEVDQVKEVFKDWQPQQALPVVPECVGNYIEECKENRYALNIALDLMVKEYASRKTELSTWVMNNQEQFAKAWFGKYEVEKPQLFYLKNKLTGLYLACDAEGYLETGRTVAEKFTQQEIDSVQTGSYKQIEVEE